MTHRIFLGRSILLFLLLFLTGCSLSPGGKSITDIEEMESEERSLDAQEDSLDDSLKNETKLWVHVCGEVKNPGVYEFSDGARVFDAVEAAGGFTKEADSDSLNLAAVLTDEGKIYVPSMGEAGGNQEISGEQSDGKLNLNTASLNDLLELPGIGEKKAEAILKFREEKGGFQKIEDLLLIEGIKEGIFNKIKDLIRI